MVLLFDNLFPDIGASVIAVGVLTAVFNERSARIQQRMSSFQPPGRDTSKLYTPELMRGLGAVIAFFGVIWLALYLAVIYGSK